MAIAVLSVLLIFGIVILVFDPFSFFVKKENPIVEKENQVVEVNEEEKALVNTLWETNSVKSDDYVGTISFESGIIDLPFVQGRDNDVYYRTDWESMKYDEEKIRGNSGGSGCKYVHFSDSLWNPAGGNFL